MNINPRVPVLTFLADYPRLLAVFLVLAFPVPLLATDGQPYPQFVAVYDARINGVPVAEVRFSLHKMDNGDYVYRRELASVGVASFFGKKVSSATSRWRFSNNWIQVLEFQSSNEDGDADDNLHLIFNWETAHVENVSAANPWQTKMPQGTLDKLVMQLALLFELRDGRTEFEYPVAHEGRIKHYRFKQVGKEVIELPMGKYHSLVVERLKEDRDKTRTWNVPELNYFPVRVLKHKQSGVKRELLLREVKFIDEEIPD